MKNVKVLIPVLLIMLMPALCLAQAPDPAIDGRVGQDEGAACVPGDPVAPPSSRDDIPPNFIISHEENGEVTILVTSDEDLHAGWVSEKTIWSVGNFDYWWLNTRLGKDPDNGIYAAVKLYEYSNPSSNFDMFALHNNGDILQEHNDWNGPGGNPLIVNHPSPNIYLGKPTQDPEGAVADDNITYIFSGSGSVLFTKIDADGTVLFSNQTIITGADSWTNSIRTAIDTNGRVYIVWSKGMHDITYAYSDDGGDTWSEQISICYNASHQLNKPQICCDANDNVHVIWQHWTGSSNLLSYMKLRPDGGIAIDESFLTPSSNQVWAAQMDIDEENNLHIVWAKSSQNVTSAYYTKINGNLDGDGEPLSDDKLSLIQEAAFLVNQNMRYPKCVVDGYENVHALFERGDYGCNHPKSVHYKKLNATPLLRIVCPDDSVLFVEMSGAGSEWQGSFTPPLSGNYLVRASGSDADGNTGVGLYEFEYSATAIDAEGGLVTDWRLSNHPNPFKPRTAISYTIASAGDARLCIYDVGGRLIKTLVDEHRAPGSYAVIWDGRNEGGKAVASGTYFYRMETAGTAVTKKMTLLR